jgi:hypothetical protein
LIHRMSPIFLHIQVIASRPAMYSLLPNAIPYWDAANLAY